MSAKDAVATMGDVLPDDAGGRDAVHVAVVSAVAKATLRPGQDVGIGDFDGKDYEAQSLLGHIGIVDPFLKGAVMKGQRFWLFLYPRSITSLNHHWTHPAFPDAKDGQVYSAPSAKLASEQWLKNYAASFGDSYEDMMEGADTWVSSSGTWGEYYYGPSDSDGMRGTYEGVSTSPEFWEHYERVRGVVVPEGKRENFFSCSC